MVRSGVCMRRGELRVAACCKPGAKHRPGLFFGGEAMPVYFLLSAVILGADQLVKAMVRASIPLLESRPFLPGVLNLTFVKNTGAAFSLFSSQTWLLTALSGVVSVVLAAALAKRLLPRPTGMLSLSLLLAGAVGNFIDRLCFGYVTDMFQTIFLNFPVFNVADIGVTVGGVLLCVSILFGSTPARKGGRR